MSILSFTSTSSNNYQVKNVSFSSYPSIDDDTFVRKLTDTSRDMSPIMVTAQEGHLDLARKEEEDGELRVFGAEKYFNGRIDEESSPKHELQQYKQQETTTDRTKLDGSASIQSESSWNSQSALLQSVLRNTKAKKSRRKSFLGSLSCNCVCSDKDSVDVAEDNLNDIRSTRYSLVHAKPVIITQEPIKTVQDHNPEPNVPIKKQMDPFEDEEKARKSLEVFGAKSLKIESRLAKLAWEANPRVAVQEEIEFEDNGVYESGSDASSDLFEIESLTGKANPFIARRSSDVRSGCVTPTSCYAPSEASIEWSVVTASAADFSALSDSEDHRFSPKTKPAKGIAQRRRPNLLLSCKSQKSVRVAGDAYIATDHKVHSPRTRHGSHVTRFEGGRNMIGFDSRQQHGFAKHQINPSHSPRPSHLLFIQ